MYLSTSPYFQDIPDIDIKATEVDEHCFDKMICKVRDEIVDLGETVTQAEVDASLQLLDVDDFKKVVDEQSDDRAILDMRNTYEYKLGHFKGALPAGTINFRETKDLFEKYKEKFAGKKVLMYCTGGIRCDKLSVLCKKHGIDNFYALDGGVVKYVHSHNDGNRLGNLYTFDGVVSKQIGDDKTHTTVGQCIYSGEPTDNATNCRYSPCNARILAKPAEFKKHAGFCSQECFDKAQIDILIKDEAFDPLDYKALRINIKREKMTLTEVQEKVRNHLRKMTLHTTFNHLTSQKEDIVDQELIDEVR